MNKTRFLLKQVQCVNQLRDHFDSENYEVNKCPSYILNTLVIKIQHSLKSISKILDNAIND